MTEHNDEGHAEYGNGVLELTDHAVAHDLASVAYHEEVA